jgi:hypothetical protein
VDQLTFTSADWAIEQDVVVVGLDDTISDGAQPVVVSMSTNSTKTLDATFSGISPTYSNTIYNLDDENVTVFVGTPTADVLADGEVVYCDVLLTNSMSGTLSISSNATGVTVEPSSVTLTVGTSNPSFKVALYGASTLISGNYLLTVSSTTSGFVSGNVAFKGVSNSVSTVWSETPSVVRENASTVSMRYRLSKAPTSDVTLTVASSDSSEISGTQSLVFTATNYNVPQVATLTVVNDGNLDGDQEVNVTWATSSTDSNFSSLTGASKVMVIDQQTADVVILQTSNEFAGEDGRTGFYQIYPTVEPTNNIVVNVAVGASDAPYATLSQSQFVFTPTNYLTNQSFTVTGNLNDSVTRTHRAFVLDMASVGGGNSYDGKVYPAKTLPLSDDEWLGITLSTNSIEVTESDNLLSKSTQVTVKLDKAPMGNVTMILASNPSSYVSISPSSVSFTPLNWNTAQTITFVGQQAGLATDSTFLVSGNVSASTDPHYLGARGFEIYGLMKTTNIAVTLNPNLNKNGSDYVYKLVDQSAGTVGFSATGGTTSTYTYSLTSAPSGNNGSLSSNVFTAGSVSGRYEIQVNNGVESATFGVYVQGAPTVKGVSVFDGVLTLTFEDLSPSSQHYWIEYSLDNGVTWQRIPSTGPLSPSATVAKPYRNKATTTSSAISVAYSGAGNGTVFRMIPTDATGATTVAAPPVDLTLSENSSAVRNVVGAVNTSTVSAITSGGGGGGCLLK